MKASSLSTYVKRALFALVSLSFISASAVTVFPARVELTAEKGGVITESFIVQNESGTEQVYYTSVENFEPQGETGTPNFVNSKDGIPSWITIAEKVTIKAGERMSVPYTITVPQDAQSGGYFSGIFLSTVPPSAKEGEVSVGAKIGVIVLLKINGDIKEEGGIKDFILKDKKNVLNSLPVSFSYRFTNNGNDRVKPEGAITIKNMFGVKVASIDANEATGNVLPNSTRKFEVTYGKEQAPEVSAPFMDHVKFQWKYFALGIYFANLDLSFGLNSVAKASVTYYVLPWQLLSLIGIVLVVVIVVLMFTVKRYNQWIIKQARKAKE